MPMKKSPQSTTLDDKYQLSSHRFFLSGTEALVRLPLLQRDLDRLRGLNTRGYISGYRGSPLGGYDRALWRAKSHLEANDITFAPGLNEDLAATAIWGTQQAGLVTKASCDGVFSIWYGKGPGVDRSIDALKHANMAGTSPFGGALAVVGDDHAAESSTLPHQSEQALMSAMIPIIAPASLRDYLELGLYAFELSRFAGCWVGFKTVSEGVESSASVIYDHTRFSVQKPMDFAPPAGGLGIRWPDRPLDKERRMLGPKLEAVAAFARANAIDKIVLNSNRARLGIAASGKAYLDLLQALDDLGIDEDMARDLGLRIYKIALCWPLEEEGAKRFADGLEQILVIEEKRSFIEEQLTSILYHLDRDRRPSIVGKRDEAGAPLLSNVGELSPAQIASALVGRLSKLGVVGSDLHDRTTWLEEKERSASLPSASGMNRTPYFCSGCPHNTSTKVPDGSRAMAGIGCHGMAVYVPDRNTAIMSHMGGEGATWIGESPFTDEHHVFQNLGDGTYAHSGLLAIRAAAAAGVNITYKILYNDAVAMTGGQPSEGSFTVQQIARQVDAEGAKRIAIVTDDPEKYENTAEFPTGTTIYHRRDLDAVQRELREVSGLSILIYDQVCAAEKRRRRKRGLYPDPPKRVFINEAVCEGCGDCSVQSNCISVQPLETEFGRKRQIDQSQCNKDFSCVNGFCPSFVTIHGATPKRAKGAAIAKEEVANDVPTPVIAEITKPYSILVTGIGGTGVITIGALIAMAAHLEGKACTTLDVTGLAQKNGAVMSHIRLAAQPENISAVRISAGGADLLLGCDIVVATSSKALSRISAGVTRAIVNTHLQPPADFVRNPDADLSLDKLTDALRATLGDRAPNLLDATDIATRLMGDSIAANAFLLGYAFQIGAIPLRLESILRAIELNGVAVSMNKQAFALGRRMAADPATIDKLAQHSLDRMERAESLDETIERRAAFLTAYQNVAWAERYRRTVNAIRETEDRIAPGQEALTSSVARNLFKLMAYKDEYEVARLYAETDFLQKLTDNFDGDLRLSFHLAPPLFADRDPSTGHLRKKEYGSWVMPAFRLLAKLRFLRGTKFDPFGWTEERRVERRLIDDYERRLLEHLNTISTERLPLLIELANVPEMIRGYGHVKEKAIAKAAERIDRLELSLGA